MNQRDDVIVRSELKSFGSPAQVGLALRGLVDRSTLVRLGIGVYAKAKPSVLTGKPIPIRPVQVLGPQALTKLGVKLEQGRITKTYNSGASTQIFASISCVDVRVACDILRGLDPITAFIFWHAKHGSLRGMTLPEALRRGERQVVIHLSQTFASQHAGTNIEPRSQDAGTS